MSAPAESLRLRTEGHVRRGIGRLRHLHIRAVAPHQRGDVKITLYDAPPGPRSNPTPLGNPMSVRWGAAADLLALLREGAEAVGITVTADGSYYAHRLPG